ncbi:MAG TPA: caspase family protein [Pyrinomonadaceae bacterium]|nr:caspase family protein [Pyrinomonadaceae bacterium]
MKSNSPLLRHLFFTFLVASLGCLAATAAQERGFGVGGQVDAGRYFALVIGNNAYQHVQRLKTAEDDAREIDAILRTQYGFQTKLLLNGTRQQIISAINSYRRELSADANLLIYYAGHGVNDKEIDKAYWLPVDARLDDNSNWISADDITSNIRGIPAKHVLVVSDSCYSGTLTRGLEASLPAPSERQRYLQKMMASKSRTLMASGGNEPVADGGGGNHSVFANALLRGLKQMERDQFTAGELFRDFVEESVAGRANQTPEYNPLRNSGHESGDFIFSRTGTARAASTTATTAGSAPANTSAAATRPVDPSAIELTFWESIKNSSDPEDFKAYLEAYPNGSFAPLARRRANVRPTGKMPAGAAPAGNAPTGNAPTGNRTTSDMPADDASSKTRNAGRENDADGAKLRGVRDYFYTLPERYLDIPVGERAGLLQSGVAVVDTKNGYISLQNGVSGQYVITVFRRTTGGYLVALRHTRPGSPAARGVSRLFFLRYDSEKWSDVTDEVLPVPFDPNLNYELPRYGTSIPVTNRAGAKVYELVWANGRFVKR